MTIMRPRALFVLTGFVIAVLASKPLEAQQDAATSYMLSIALAGGAVGSYQLYRNEPPCRNYFVAQPQGSNQCDNEDVKAFFFGATIVCAVGSLIELVHGIHLSRSNALVTFAPRTAPSLGPPNLGYDFHRHEVRALLIHGTF